MRKVKAGLEARAKARAAEVQRVEIPGGVFGRPNAPSVVVQGPVAPGAERQLPATPSEVQLVEETRQKARAVAGRWDAHLRELERRLERKKAELKPYELELEYLETQAVSRVYAGLFGKINSFLHVQAL